MEQIYLTPKEGREVSVIIAEHYETTLDELLTENRADNIKEARSISCWMLYTYFGFSQANISRIFNQRKCNVWHHVKRINNQIEVDKSYKDLINRLTRIVNNKINTEFEELSNLF